MTYHGARVYIGFDTLAQILDLPPGWRIMRVMPSRLMFEEDQMELLIEGPNLPAVEAGQVPPEVVLEYSTDFRPGFNRRILPRLAAWRLRSQPELTEDLRLRPAPGSPER